MLISGSGGQDNGNSPRFDHAQKQHVPASLVTGGKLLSNVPSRHPSPAVTEAVAVPAAGVSAFCLDPCLHLDRLQGGIAALSEALANVDKAAVKSLGISGQQHGFVPVDKDGEVSLEHAPAAGAGCLHVRAHFCCLTFELIPGLHYMSLCSCTHTLGSDSPRRWPGCLWRGAWWWLRHSTCKTAGCSCAQGTLMAGAGACTRLQHETCPCEAMPAAHVYAGWPPMPAEQQACRALAAAVPSSLPMSLASVHVFSGPAPGASQQSRPAANLRERRSSGGPAHRLVPAGHPERQAVV